MTWEQFCTNYTPGRYGRYTSDTAIQHDADILERILFVALSRLDTPRRAAA